MLLNPCVSRIFFKIEDNFKAVYSIKARGNARGNTRYLILHYLISNNVEKNNLFLFLYFTYQHNFEY